MQSDNSKTKFGADQESRNSFIHGSLTNEICLQAFNHSKDKSLTNAIEFSHPDEEIKICVYRQPGLWEFQVKAQGVGMPEEVQSLQLKIDDRKQKTGASGEVGSGFGLLLCEGLIQRNGEHLSWDSTLGEGSSHPHSQYRSFSAS